MKKYVTAIAIIVGIVLLVGCIFYFYKPSSIPDTSLITTQDINAPRTPPQGQKEYHSEQYGFSLFYPEELLVREFNEGEGALTFIFENEEKELGFQIFAVPFIEDKISDKRFLMDAPSGVRDNLSSFYIDKVLVTSFYSKSLELGDTFEIWFVHYGLLYEVTTFRREEVWLGHIMDTWLFRK